MPRLPRPTRPAANPISAEMHDAANELATRIELGEFDDLDDDQMEALRTLSTMMERWATVAEALEARLSQPRDGLIGDRANPPLAFRN